MQNELSSLVRGVNKLHDERIRITRAWGFPMAALLFVVFFCLFFALSPKTISGSNDGAHFALIRSIDTGSFPELTPTLMPYTGYVQFAEFGEKLFSDRPPGVAFLSLPFYYGAKFIASSFDLRFLPPLLESGDGGMRDNMDDYFPQASFAVATVTLVPNLAAAGTVTLVYLILVLLYPTRRIMSALLAALTGVGTVLAPYGATYMSHAVTAFFVTASFYALLRFERSHRPSWRTILLAGFLVGVAASTDYQVVPYVAGFFIYALIRLIPMFAHEKKSFWIHVGAVCAGFSVPAIAILAYHTVLFHNPLHTTFTHHGFYLYAHTAAGLFSGNLLAGLQGLLFSTYRHGFLFMSPFLAVGVALALVTIQKHWPEKILLLTVSLANVVLVALLKEWDGASFYPRYLVWSVVLLAILSGMGVLEIIERFRGMRRWQKMITIAPLTLFVAAAMGALYRASLAPAAYAGTKTGYQDCAQGLLCKMKSGLPGLAHWPLALPIIFLTIAIILCVFVYRGSRESGRSWFGVACGVMLAFLIMSHTALRQFGRVADWQQRETVIHENFNVWKPDEAQGKTEDELAHPSVALTKDARNVRGLWGNAVYPGEFAVPARIEYRVPVQYIHEELILHADATVVGKGNRVRAFLQMISGSPIEIFTIDGQDSERRYRVDRPVIVPDEPVALPLLVFEMEVQPGSKTLGDARLNFFSLSARKPSAHE